MALGSLSQAFSRAKMGALLLYMNLVPLIFFHDADGSFFLNLTVVNVSNVTGANDSNAENSVHGADGPMLSDFAFGN